MSKKSPQLRFEGFTDDWEERKSKDIFKPKIRKGEPDLPVLSVTQTSGVVYRDEVGIDIKYDISTLKNYKVIEPNDFVISLRSFQGGFELSDKLGITSPAYTIFVPKSPEEQNNLFWRIQFKRFQFIQSLKTVTFGIRDGKSISFNEFGELKIKFPSNILEQQKIGAFFKKLDDTIALHQRKLDLLKEQKKGYLQKMFPKNGAKVPELRFAGFADDWELRKLNEVSDIYDGTHQTPKYQDDGVMFLSVENIKTLTSNKFISREAFEVEFKIRPQRGDVLMTRIGDIGTANVVETDEDLAYYVSLALFKSEELNPYFLQASIYAPFVQDQIWKRTLHIAFPKKINKNEIGQVPINVPTLAEQTKIGSFFKQLDNTITLHQHKLDLLKEQKKGFLQKMFV